jgi:hypothetical protein
VLIDCSFASFSRFLPEEERQGTLNFGFPRKTIKDAAVVRVTTATRATRWFSEVIRV